MVGPLVRPKSKNDPSSTYVDNGFLRVGDDRDIFVTHMEVEKDGFLKLKDFYEALHNFLEDDNFRDPIDGSGNFESLYWERILANGKKEHHIWWRAVKTPTGMEEGNYLRYALKFDIQTLYLSKDEIAYKGRKAKVDAGDIIIRIWFWLQWDPKDKFKNSFINNLKGSFLKNMYKSEIEQHWVELYNYGEKLRNYIKVYLDLQEAGEQPRLFEPESGYKDQFAP